VAEILGMTNSLKRAAANSAIPAAIPSAKTGFSPPTKNWKIHNMEY
jgi:hypothetical protein